MSVKLIHQKTMETIYLIRLVSDNSNTLYKIGRTSRPFMERLKEYKNKDPSIVFVIECADSNKVESDLIKIFRNLFKHRTDVGTEYFDGDVDSMKKVLSSYFTGNIEYTLNMIQGLISTKVCTVHEDGDNGEDLSFETILQTLKRQPPEYSHVCNGCKAPSDSHPDRIHIEPHPSIISTMKSITSLFVTPNNFGSETIDHILENTDFMNDCYDNIVVTGVISLIPRIRIL